MPLSSYYTEISTSYEVTEWDDAGRPRCVTFPTAYGPSEPIGSFDDCMVYFLGSVAETLPGPWFWHGCGNYTRVAPDDIHQYYDVNDMCDTRISRAAMAFENRRVRRLLQAGERGRLPWVAVWELWAAGELSIKDYYEQYEDRLYRRRLLTRPGPKTGAKTAPLFAYLRRRIRPLLGAGVVETLPHA